MKCERSDRRRGPGGRWIRALGLLALLPLVAGCVYLRLLDVKHQLGDFERNFILDESSGLRLTFRHPVLLDRDLAFLGLATTHRTTSGHAERWRITWVKRPSADAATEAPPAPPVTESLDLVLVDHRLSTVIVPESFFVFFPKSVVAAGLRSLGRARVDREARVVSAEVATGGQPGPVGPPVLPRTALFGTLGEPTETGGTVDALEWRYRFEPAPEAKGSGPIDLTFTIDPASGLVRRIRGRLIRGTVEFNYPIPSAAAAAGPPAKAQM